MKIILQSYAILDDISEGGVEELQKIESIGRTCYKSSNYEGDFEKTKAFVARLIESGHESVLEHSSLSVLFTTDRGVTHELVRHRLASYTQESTRYCNYAKGKFGKEITFIMPVEFASYAYDSEERRSTVPGWIDFYAACRFAEERYLELIDKGCPPQLARAVLPNATKADICVTANYREWRHILKLRTAKDAHPQIRSLMIPLLTELQRRIPVIFDDIAI